MTLKLTAAQKRHLSELAAVGEHGGWRAVRSGEARCAEALFDKGLLRREYGWGGRWVYFLTDEGRAAVEGL